MADVAMYHVKKELRSPTPSGLSASPYPFQQRTTTTVATTTTHSSASSALPPMAMQSLASSMAFDLDFLDPAAPLALPHGVGAASAASLHAAASHNPLDDLNLLDAQPPLLTLPGDSDHPSSSSASSSATRVVVTTSSQFAHTQQHFSDASSVSSVGSPDHPGLSPTTTHSQTSSFGSSPATPNSPNSPLSPAQPMYANAGIAAAVAAAALRPTGPAGLWNLSVPNATLPLPLYPLSASTAAPLNGGLPTIYTPAQPAGTKRGVSPLSVSLPQPAPRSASTASASATAATAKPSASAARSPPASAAAPASAKPKKTELASAAKGRRGGGKGKAAAATGSPSASDDDDVDGGDTGSTGSGDDKLTKRERNKVSAMKYRKRRKVYLDGLESKVQGLNDTVTSLHTENKLLKEQLDFLKNLLRNGGELPSSPIKFGDSSKPMSHAANQPPVLPKIPRPSQMPAHSTLALFCVMACVLLCVTSPDAFFGSFGPATPLTSLSAANANGPSAMAPPSELAHSRQSRYLLQHNCLCPRPSAAAAATPDAAGGDAAPTVSAGANPQQTNHTECACADGADEVDALEVEAPVAAACEGAPEPVPTAVPLSAPAVAVH